MSVRVPVSVLRAIGTIDDFLYENKRITRAVAQPRSRWDTKKTINDRVNYHRTAAANVRRDLMEVIASNS